jgi:hypothetical protein
MQLPLFLRQYFVALNQLFRAVLEFKFVFLRLGYNFQCSLFNFLLEFDRPRYLLVDLSDELERLTSQFHVLASKFVEA